MPKANKLTLVGIGYRPLGGRAREIVRKADVVLASSRLFDVFKRYEEYEAVKERITVINKVPETVAYIKEWFSQSAIRNPRPELGSKAPQSELPSLVLLASGDPFFFGIGRRMIEEFGKERIEIIPDLSSMQEAFARINEPWDDAFCISVHGGPDIARRRKLPYEAGDIPRLLEKYRKLAILTDRVNNPTAIAGELLNCIVKSPQPPFDKGGQGGIAGGMIMHVCERLGYPDERVWTGTINEAAGMTFAEPNVVIIQRQGPGARVQGPGEVCFGLKEEELSHARGLITKDEVRAVTLHKLKLPQSGVLWDIGAGSGSVSIEAARLFPGLRIFAVEKDEDQVNHINNNMRRFSVKNIEVVKATAPEELTGLPAPDRVFIGGSGGRLAAIVELASGMMRSGIIVINAATLETLRDGVAALEQRGFTTDVCEVSVSRSKPVAGKKLMNALNPVFIVRGEKGK